MAEVTNLDKLLEYLGYVQEQLSDDSDQNLSAAIEQAEIRWGWKYGTPRGGSFARSNYWHPAYEFIWEAANEVGKHNPCWQVAVELADLSPEDKETTVKKALDNIRWLKDET
jgi:hypothetical protein